jgi:hypothetical protein
LEDIEFHNCPNLICIPEYLINEDYRYNNEIYTNYAKCAREQCSKMVFTILEELIARTWHPSRVVDWCWDEDEKRFMNDILS